MEYTTVPQFSENEAIDLERLNAMIANMNYLNQSGFAIKYSAHGLNRTTGMKMAVGLTDANNPNYTYRNRWINVGNFFTPGCVPIASASFASLKTRKATIAIAERTGASVNLDHTGLSVYVASTDGTKMTAPNRIHYILVGY